MLQRLDGNLRIQKSSGPDDLLDHERRTRRVHIKFFQRLVGWRELRMPPACVVIGSQPGRMRYIFPSDREGDKFLFPNPLSPMWDVCLIANDAVLNFKFCWCRAHVDDLVGHLHELTKIE